MENQERQLSLIYNKNISVSGLTGIFIEKECVVRKKSKQYAAIILDGIRYLIFEDKKGNKNYTILGRKMTQGKFKNYFLAALTIEEAVKISGASDVLDKDDMKKILEHLVSKYKNHKKKFFDYVKMKYDISY